MHQTHRNYFMSRTVFIQLHYDWGILPVIYWVYSIKKNTKELNFWPKWLKNKCQTDMPLIPALMRNRQKVLCEYEATTVCTKDFRVAKDTQRDSFSKIVKETKKKSSAKLYFSALFFQVELSFIIYTISFKNLICRSY